MNFKIKRALILLFAAHSSFVSAQLSVTPGVLRVTGEKVVVPLKLENKIASKIESARAAVFLMDEKGKMVGQGMLWVIGGGKGKEGLAAGATNVFHFVVTTEKPVTATNLTARVNFSRLVLEGGKVVEIKGNVVVKEGEK
jgi:hypothetical protein